MKMKKLMIAAAAALWATVGMADVESANIVGYADADLNENYTGIGPMFFNVGEDVISISNLKVEGLGECMGAGYTIAPVSQSGSLPVKYYWYCGLSDYGIADGWYTNDDAEVLAAAAGEGTLDSYKVSGNIAKAEGLVTFMTDAGLSLRGAGEVSTNDYTRPLNENYTGIANPYPVSVKLSSMSILGLDECMGAGYSIAPVSQSGSLPVKYYWYCGLSGYGISDGWYTNDDAEVLAAAAEQGTLDSYKADVTFKAGQAAVTFMTDAGLSLKIASPIAK